MRSGPALWLGVALLLYRKDGLVKISVCDPFCQGWWRGHQATHIMRNPEVASGRSQVSRCSVPECSSHPVPPRLIPATGLARTLSSRRPGSRPTALKTGWVSPTAAMDAPISAARPA